MDLEIISIFSNNIINTSRDLESPQIPDLNSIIQSIMYILNQLSLTQEPSLQILSYPSHCLQFICNNNLYQLYYTYDNISNIHNKSKFHFNMLDRVCKSEFIKNKTHWSLQESMKCPDSFTLLRFSNANFLSFNNLRIYFQEKYHPIHKYKEEMLVIYFIKKINDIIYTHYISQFLVFNLSVENIYITENADLIFTDFTSSLLLTKSAYNIDDVSHLFDKDIMYSSPEFYLLFDSMLKSNLYILEIFLFGWIVFYIITGEHLLKGIANVPYELRNKFVTERAGNIKGIIQQMKCKISYNWLQFIQGIWDPYELTRSNVYEMYDNKYVNMNFIRIEIIDELNYGEGMKKLREIEKVSYLRKQRRRLR